MSQIKTENGLYYYKGIPYVNLMDAKKAEMDDSATTVSITPTTSGIPTRQPIPDSVRAIGEEYTKGIPSFGTQRPNVQPPMAPKGLIEGLNVGGRGSYAGPATGATPVSAINPTQPNQPTPTQPQQPKPEPSFMDKLTSKQGIGAIGAGLLSLSNDPRLQAMGAQQMQDFKAQKAQTATRDRYITALKKMGMPEGQVMALAENPDALKQVFVEMYKRKNGLDTPADLQKFNALTEGWSDEDKQKAARVMYGLDPRAASSLSITPEMLFNRAYMTQGGKGSAEEEINSAKKMAERASGMRMFEFGLANLEEKLLGTTTGKIAGLFPALTGNQQLADQAKSLMAPILKQTFRAAGEGVFTDKDQELLLGMIPDRSMAPEAISQAIQNIQMLVELKLRSGDDVSVEDLFSRFGMTPSAPASATPPAASGGSGGFTIKRVN